MPNPIQLKIHARLGAARVGTVTTPHGSFDTPAFMTVGTRASVKGILPELVHRVGGQVILNNTFHLMLRPGSQCIAQLGGVHRFMNYNGPILTDSGGYQAYSMADINAIDDDGVTFKSIVDGSMVRLTPEHAIEIQNQLGADIMMAFDDCPPSIDPASKSVNQARLRHAAARDSKRVRTYDHAARLRTASERTIRWLERCKAAHSNPNTQALFGIIQGGTDLEQRTWCAERVCNIDLPGYAIGGVAVGEPFEQIATVTRHTACQMPEDKPRYLMGVGYERDIVAAVRSGIDMFDCVLPTRNGRNANAFTSSGQIRLRNAVFADDSQVIEPECDCPACDPHRYGWASAYEQGFSRAYIRHLFMSGEMLGPILVTLHNLRHFQRLMLDIRHAIRHDGWSDFALRWPVASEGLKFSASVSN